MVKRDIKVRYRRSVLGIFWSFLEPLLMLVVLTIIFSTLFQRSIPNYPVFLITGLLIFNFFAQSTMGAMLSIRGNAGIIRMVYVPKYLFALSSIVSTFITFLISLSVLFMVMLATQVDFTIYIIFASLPILLLLIFCIGVGLILATVAVFFRDVEHLYGVFVMLLRYATPIFYPPDIIPASFSFIYQYNPVYAVIASCRDVFMNGTLYDPVQVAFAGVSAIVALLVGMFLFYKYQNKFILYL
jgi:lipopolysaccharide transport system permease protein